MIKKDHFSCKKSCKILVVNIELKYKKLLGQFWFFQFLSKAQTPMTREFIGRNQKAFLAILMLLKVLFFETVDWSSACSKGTFLVSKVVYCSSLIIGDLKNLSPNLIIVVLFSTMYFRLKPLDIEFMKRLHEKVNIIPLIAKADTLTPEECQQFKKQVSKTS